MSIENDKLMNLADGKVLYDDLRNRVENRIEKPSTAGTSGQVLVSDGQGGQTWSNTSGSTVIDDTLSISGAAADAAATGSLKSAISSMEDIILGTKAIEITWDANGDGKYIGATGTIGSSASFHYSDLLPVINGIDLIYTFSFTNATDSSFRIHGYDASGDWVKQITYKSTKNAENDKLFIDTSDKRVKYIRLSVSKNATSTSLAIYGIANSSVISDLINTSPIKIAWDAESTGKFIRDNGTVGETSGGCYSELLPFKCGKCHVMAVSETASNTRIHAYDENGVWIKMVAKINNEVTGWAKVTTFDLIPAYKHIRISAVDDTKIIIWTENQDDDIERIKYGFNKGSVCLSTANAICKCVQSYLDHNSDFIYGQNGTATKWNENGFIDSDTGKYRIDCSTLALLVIMGVDYDHSLYNLSNDQNVLNAMGYGFNPFWGQSNPWDVHDLYGTYTYQMCKEYAEMGCTVDIIDRDFSGVQPGDLIFWGSTTAQATVGRYKRLRHVDVVLARYGAKDAIVADAGSVPITVHLASDRIAEDNIAVVARLPLGVAPKNTLDVFKEHYATPTDHASFSITHSVPWYTPVAYKIRVTQTEDTGSVTLTSATGTAIATSETFNAGTNGKTFDIIGCGYTHAGNITAINVDATGAAISDIWINFPATAVECDS